MGAAEEERRAQLLAAELAEHDHLVVHLDPVEALSVIGMLQLALRHPNAPASTSQIAVAFIDRVVHAYGLRGPDSREFVRAVAEGFDADLDVDARRDAEAGSLIPPHIRERMTEVIDRPLALERLGCRCPDPARAVDPGCPWHGHSPEVFGGSIPVEVDEAVPPGVIEVRGETTTVVRLDPPPGDVATARPPAWRPSDVVRPAGLVWSGIRVDEFEGIGYTITEPGDDGPLLEPGEIYGVPLAMTIYVWSRADFDRLAELSRTLHDARRRGLPVGQLAAALGRELSGPIDQVESLEIVRALPAGGR